MISKGQKQYLYINFEYPNNTCFSTTQYLYLQTQIRMVIVYHQTRDYIFFTNISNFANKSNAKVYIEDEKI